MRVRSEREDARKIDATCKNKWKWSWFMEKDENQHMLGKLVLVAPHFPLVYSNTVKVITVKDLLKHAMKSTELSHELKHELSVYVCKKVVHCMKKYPFSINIDECTSNNSQKVFSIPVSYFDIEIGESVVKHYEPVSLIEVNAKFLLECFCNCFIRDDIPFQNLVSDLSDGTNYMRG